MKKLITILIVLLSLSSLQESYSQNYFNNRYDINASWDGATSIVEVDSGYYVVGFDFDSLWWYASTLITYIDTAGNTVWKKEYGEPYYNYFQGGRGSFISLSDGGFALFGGVVDTAGNNDALLMRFNSQGDTLWTKQYGDTAFQAGSQIKQTDDKGFILIGRTTSCNIKTDYWLIKTDSLGNVQWEQCFGGVGTEYGASVDICTDGGYILTGTTLSYGPNSGITSSAENNIYIIKTDSLGNQLWNRVIGDVYADWAWNVEQTMDGGFVIGGSQGNGLNGSNSRPYIIKLDSAGNTMWDETYGGGYFDTGLQMIRELSDGSFIACGEANNNFDDPFNQYYGLVIKVGPTGDSLWYRTYRKLTGSSTSINILADITPTSDGGFIATGYVSPAPPDTGTQDIWVLKLDSEGCEYSGCGPFTTIEETPLETDTETNIRVYPNPATESFTVAYQLPKDSETAKFICYDLTGKQVLEKTIVGETGTTIISTNGLSKGLYFYVVIVNNAIIATDKIVINK